MKFTTPSLSALQFGNTAHTLVSFVVRIPLIHVAIFSTYLSLIPGITNQLKYVFSNFLRILVKSASTIFFSVSPVSPPTLGTVEVTSP